MLYSACVSRPWLNGIPFWEYRQIPDGTCPVRYLDFFEIKRKKRKKMCLAMVLFVNITDGVTCLTLESMHPLNSTVECSYTVENSQWGAPSNLISILVCEMIPFSINLCTANSAWYGTCLCVFVLLGKAASSTVLFLATEFKKGFICSEYMLFAI